MARSAGNKSNHNSPASQNIIYEENGSLYLGKDKKKLLARFTIKLKQIIEKETTRHFLLELNDGENKGEVLIEPCDFIHSKVLKKKFLKLHESFFFSGNDSDAEKLLVYIRTQEHKSTLVKGVSVSGIHESKNGYLLVTPYGAWNKNGENINTYKYNPDNGIAFPKIDYGKNITSVDIQQFADLILKYNRIDICTAIVSWLGLLPFAPRLRKMTNFRLPVLMLFGERGSGKTQTIVNVIGPLAGIRDNVVNLSGLTEFTLLSKGAASNVYPVYVDEVKPRSGIKKVQLLSNIIRMDYDNQPYMRGNSDMVLNEWRIYSPLILSGEASFEEPAIAERSIRCDLAKNQSLEHLNDFNRISKIALEDIHIAYMRWSLEMKDRQLYNYAKKYKFNEYNTDRGKANVQALKLGIHLFDKFFEFNKVSWDYKSAQECIDTIIQQGVRETIRGKSTVDMLVEKMYYFWKAKYDKSKHYSLNFSLEEYDGIPVFIFHPKTFYPEFQKSIRQERNDMEILSYTDFVRQLKTKHYYLKTQSHRFRRKDESTSEPFTCIYLKIDDILNAGILDESEISTVIDDVLGKEFKSDVNDRILKFYRSLIDNYQRK